MHRHPTLPQSFAELGLNPAILRALAAIDFERPTDIQREVIPAVLTGRDVLGQARTGTGKTAAFGLPILQMVDPEERLQALVLTPTRELAAQVVGEFRRYARFLPIHCVPIYGGTRIKEQIHQLGRKPHVAVGTPGRVMDLMGRGVLSFDGLRFAVLDEVDRMLDIGFRDDIRRILGTVRHPHQTVFVSATITEEINRLARQYMRDPIEVNVSRDHITVDEVSQYYCTVEPYDKPRLLRLLLKQENPALAIVFCNTKHGARRVARRLHADGIEAKEIHGDLVQQKREKIMERFRRHKIPVLVATDLASRGIDVHRVTHIINYDVPQDPQAYVHRIGRTARMGQIGKAIMFVTREEGDELTAVEMIVNKQLERLHVEGFTPSEPRDDDRRHRGGPRTPADSTPFAAPQAPEQAAPLPAPAAAPVGVQTRRPQTLAGKFPVRRRRHRR